MYRIKISDLRRLSLRGNATVKLDKAYEPKPVEITNDAPQQSQSKSHSI